MRDRVDIYKVTASIINKIDGEREYSSGKAILANLRNSVGKSLSSTVEVWPLLFENFPDHYLSESGRLTEEEQSVLLALQLYAIHQQGKGQSVNSRDREDRFERVIRKLRIGGESQAIDRRFNTLITATEFTEFSHHLRQLIKLLRSKLSDVKINYPALAEDLYWYQRGYSENIVLRWGKAYYSSQEDIKEQVND